MLHSLRVRMLVVLILVVVVTVGAIGILSTLATNRMFYDFEKGRTETRQHRFEGVLIRHYARGSSWSGAQALVERIGQISGEHVIVSNVAGQVVADSTGELLGQLMSHGEGALAVQLTHEGAPIGVLHLSTYSPNTRRDGGGLVGVRIPPLPLHPPGMDPASEIFLNSLNRALLLVAVVAGAMAVVLSLVLSHRILGPVEALTAATRRVQRGDLSQRVSVQSKDEIGELATAFNAMAEGLQRQEELRRNMVTDVAHELRTPLSNVRGYLEAFRDGVMKPDSTNVDSVYEEAMLLNRLVDDLQELSLAEAGELRLERRTVSLAEVLNRTVEALQARAAAKGVSLETGLPEDLPAIDADPHRLAQILGNLLNNGLTHTPAGGKVRVTASASDGMIGVVVSDTGQGIAAEHLPYIFERFYRVDPSRARSTGGVGLGLAIAKQLVEAHGGSISVRSIPGQGTEFTLYLPVTEADVQIPVGKA